MRWRAFEPETTCPHRPSGRTETFRVTLLNTRGADEAVPSLLSKSQSRTEATMSDALPAIGRIGVFSAPLEVMPRSVGVEFAAELEELGYGAIWSGEGLGTREIFANACGILAGTRSIVFGAGIANVWAATT